MQSCISDVIGRGCDWNFTSGVMWASEKGTLIGYREYSAAGVTDPCPGALCEGDVTSGHIIHTLGTNWRIGRPTHTLPTDMY